MKKFESPQMTLIHFAGEKVIYTSGCTSVCNGHQCDECECSGGFGSCQWRFTCENYECSAY